MIRDRAELDERIEALAIRFQDGEFSETVYRASLFALGRRGSEIDEIVKPQLEILHDRRKRV